MCDKCGAKSESMYIYVPSDEENFDERKSLCFDCYVEYVKVKQKYKRFITEEFFSNEKQILIPQEDLKTFIKSDITLTALENGGVDNWEWYGESISDFVDEYKRENDINDEKEYYIEDIIEQTLRGYLNE